MKCINCDSEVDNSLEICNYCGAKLEKENVQNVEKGNNIVVDNPNIQSTNDSMVVVQNKKESNVFSILGLIFSFIIPILGLIFSIIGLKKVKKVNSGKTLSIVGLIISLINIIIVVVLLAIIIFGYSVYLFNSSNSSNTGSLDSEEHSALVDYNDKDVIDYPSYGYTGVIYIGKNGENYYSIVEKDDNIVGEYKCKESYCYSFDETSKYLLVYDKKEYILYDYINDKETILNIPYIKYSYINLAEKNDDIVGLILEKEDDDSKTAYYDLKKNKMKLDFGKFDYIYCTKYSLLKNYIFVADYKSYEYSNYRLYSLDNDKVVKENITGMYTNKKATYYYYNNPNSAEDYIQKIYDEKFNEIVSFDTSDNASDYVSEYIFTDDGEFIYEYQNKINIIKNNKLSYTSKEYKKIYNVLKDYIVVNIDNKLVLLDYNEKEVAVLTELTDKNYVHNMISGWYTDNGKNGVYIVVEDDNIKCEDIDEKHLTSFFGDSYNESLKRCREEAESMVYEYYYIPSTGETGRIATVQGGYAKPVLYLYPEKNNTNISVSFEKPELLTTTYPKYNKVWNVVANKNGDLYDKNGRYYYGLYWEELGSNKVSYNEGFYVTKDNALKFLEEKLDIIGFTEREANEFIMYWLPILEKNGNSLVYFELTEERDSYNKLKINPQPDSMLRVAIHVKKANKKVDIKEQKLTKFNRKGFSAIEWGGVID